MNKKLVDIIEDIAKGINMEQLVKKPKDKKEEDAEKGEDCDEGC